MVTGIPTFLSLALMVLNIACSAVGLVCFILVVVQMFMRDESTMGIISLVTVLLCGVGFFVAFIYGWTKSAAWNIKKVMISWTIAIVLSAVLVVVAVALAFATIPAGQPVPFDTGPDDMELDIDFGGGDFGGGDFGGGDFGGAESIPEPETGK